MILDPLRDGKSEVRLVDCMGDDDRSAMSARVSFLNDDCSKGSDRLNRFLIREGHTSPFEHSVLTLRIKAPLFVRSQIMRHRTFSFNEVSRRYTSELIEFYLPTSMRAQASKDLQASTDEPYNPFVGTNGWDGTQVTASDALRMQVESCVALYESMLASGVAREMARMVLPQNLYTTWWQTGSLHNWIKFIKLRSSSHAQQETRFVSNSCLEIIESKFPNTVKAFREVGGLEA